MRAAFPFRFLRKYSFARRTRAERTTSTLAIVGECRGKMRSTPWPNETLRTVKEARTPPRCWPITMPSKIWMRSLSPSRTFTCTFTVSPDFIAGRSVIWAFSTMSIALIAVSPSLFVHRVGKQIPLLAAQRAFVNQIRAPLQRPPQRLRHPPAAHFGVMPREQHVRHAPAFEFRRPRVVRVVQDALCKRILFHRFPIAHDARHEPAHRVD